jgi:hypothetical protein
MEGQDIQSRFEPRHTGGKAGVVGAALLLEMLGNALAMGRDLVRTHHSIPRQCTIFFIHIGLSYCTLSHLRSTSRS